jgi:hypothetical protein
MYLVPEKGAYAVILRVAKDLLPKASQDLLYSEIIILNVMMRLRGYNSAPLIRILPPARRRIK